MIKRMADIYKEVSREQGLSLSIVESVGIEVLSCLRNCLNNPSEIAYELPNLGTFTLKHTKYESFHKFLIDAVETGKYKLDEDYPTDTYERNGELMKKIEEFRQHKEEVNKLKDEFKEKSGEPSQGEPEEHK